MRGTWVTDMTHFLGPDGQLAITRGTLVPFLAAIVEATTGEGGSARPVRCRRRPGRRPCQGEIRSSVDASTQEIRWRCSSCDDDGYISNWQGTPWDQRSGRLASSERGSSPETASWTIEAARAWSSVPAEIRLRILNNVCRVACRVNTFISITCASVRGGDLVLRGSCTTCGGDVARVVEEVG